jgi:predicted DNA-binding transcriptional regulator YafY
MPQPFNPGGSKYNRLSYIYDRLSRSPDGVTIKDLAEELGVSTKTIQRDLHDTLADNGVYCEGRRWKLNRKGAEDGLDKEDRIVLGVLDSLAKQAGNAFYAKAHQLLEQVSCQLEHPLFANLNTEILDEKHLNHFSLLENAIKSKRIIETDYISVSKRNSRFRLKPLRLAFFDGFWYLLAFDTSDNDTFKKFHLKSLSNITLAEEIFIYPKKVAEAVERMMHLKLDYGSTKRLPLISNANPIKVKEFKAKMQTVQLKSFYRLLMRWKYSL